MGKALKAAKPAAKATAPSVAKTTKSKDAKTKAAKPSPAGAGDIAEALIAAQPGTSKRAANDAVKAVVDAMADLIVKRQGLRISGLGTFRVNERAARQGRNPFTGETIQIPARKLIAFRAGKDLKAAVDGAGKTS